jgi:hypothetical protein
LTDARDMAIDVSKCGAMVACHFASISRFNCDSGLALEPTLSLNIKYR